jgi:hypothetical protein
MQPASYHSISLRSLTIFYSRLRTDRPNELALAGKHVLSLNACNVYHSSHPRSPCDAYNLRILIKFYVTYHVGESWYLVKCNDWLRLIPEISPFRYQCSQTNTGIHKTWNPVITGGSFFTILRRCRTLRYLTELLNKIMLAVRKLILI